MIAGAVLVGAAQLTSAAGAQAPAPAAQCGTTAWVAAWTANPTGLVAAASTNQTLRIILTPHLASSQLRVHVSNRFGVMPVTFARASVGLRQAGASLIAGSSRQLTFGGAASVTVPAGGDATSDPAALSFSAFQDLAVSLYMADASGPGTGHLIARQRSYASARSSGDHTGEESPAAFSSSTETTAYVDAVDALAPAGVGAAVLVGDSITDGFVGGGSGEDQTGIDGNQRYPDYVARRLLAERGGPRLSVLNAGISGNRLLADAPTSLIGASGVSRLGADVFSVAGVSDVIVLEGINDIALGANGAQVTGALAQIVSQVHAHGLRVFLGTLTPAGTGLLSLGSLIPALFIPSTSDVARASVNNWIRSGASGADGVFDFDTALQLAGQPNRFDPRFDSGDHLHPSAAGYSRMADAVNLAGLRGGACAPAPAQVATSLHVRARVLSTGRRLRVSGSLAPSGAGGCAAGTDVTLRAVRARHTILRRSIRVTSDCLFSKTAPIRRGRGRIEIRLSFGGSPALLPTRARPVFVRGG